MDNAAFMDEFFCQVSVTTSGLVYRHAAFISSLLFYASMNVNIFIYVVCIISRLSLLYVCLFQIEDIRSSIDKIDENVSEVKKLYSVILSAPTSDQSKMP